MVRNVQADRAAQELPSLVAPISRGLNAAVERVTVLEHSCLRHGDAIQAPDLESALARWECANMQLLLPGVVSGVSFSTLVR